MAKWQQDELEKQESLIKFLRVPIALRDDEEAKLQLENIKASEKVKQQEMKRFAGDK